MIKVLFIVGPTGVGKTDLALYLANKFNGDLISADSVQVFKKLDIISGKDLPKGYIFQYGYYSCIGNPSIYLLDVVEPTKSFSVQQFYDLASKYVQYIGHTGKLPIVVGGSGLYIQTLIKGFYQSAKPDLKLRRELGKLSMEKLQIKLKNLNPHDYELMNESDRKNPRKLVRKIELLLSGESNTNQKPQNEFQSMVVGLRCVRELLKKRIEKRVEERLKNGAIEESKSLFKNYMNLSQQIKDANGYKQLFAYLKNEISLDEAIYRWKISEYRHAKNQMTWFQKYGDVKWFDIEDQNYRSQIENSLKLFLD